MPYNGTGTFTRLYNWVTDATNLIPITASRFDGEDDDFAEGLSSCITKDGQTIITSNIPMNSKKFTGLTNGSARTDSIALGQVQDGSYTALGLTAGAADAYTSSPTPAITAYSATMQFRAKIHATNLTTTPYLQISGIALPASTAVIKKYNASATEIAVEAGDLLIGKIYHFDRNVANDAWIVTNPEKPYFDSRNLSQASTGLPGVSEFATDAELAAGTDTNKSISPAALLSLYPASSKAANGYVRSPINNSSQFQSIFEQWGEKANIPANTTVTVTLPGSFTTTMFAAKTTAFGTNTAATEYAMQVSNFTVSSFDITNANGAARSVYWSAIGY